MKSRIWRLATAGLICLSVGSQALAEERGDGPPQHQGRPDGGQQHGQQQGQQGQGGNNQSRPEQGHWQGQGRPQGQQWNQHQGNQPRPDNHQPSGRPGQPGNNLVIQPRPDAVQQSQRPPNGHWQTAPRPQGNSSHWQGGDHPRPGYNPGASNGRPDVQHWPGRPGGHGNGWGPGPQYRPGYIVDRFPDRHWQVPYRGQNYFFSGGYWYRPQGPRYVVVQPPYGIRVGYLPDYAREVWVGGSLLFLAAGAYYAYQPASQDYIVVQPPTAIAQPMPQSQGNGYDVVAYPANGQSAAQIDQDRYDCYRWAVDQSGFDPAKVTYAPSPAVVQTYRQAQGNCLGSRGYQVNY